MRQRPPSREYTKGYLAAEQGRSLDNCRYRITWKRIEWHKGYQQALADRERNQARHSIKRSEQARQRHQHHIARLREQLNGEP